MDVAKKNKKRRKRKLFLGILVVLVAVRIWLPYWIKNQLVSAINSVEGYECTIEDVDLAVYRGAMIIEQLKINITTNKVTEPFVFIKNSDISVEWGAIFDGSIVGEIVLDSPILHFSDGNNKEEQQVGNVSWVDPVLDFIPLKINRFEIINGKVEFKNAVSKPPVNLELTEITFLAKNLTNSQDLNDLLPSDVNLTSKILDGGRLNLKGDINILKKIPDMDLDFKMQNVDLVQLNNFSTAYASFDFEKGNFELGGEFAMKNGEIEGYVKPILNDVSIFNFKEKGPLLNKVWQAFLGFIVEITENQKKNQTGTKVPISGRYDNPKIGIFKTIIGIFENAFINAYTINTDGTINFKDIGKKKKSDAGNKK